MTRRYFVPVLPLEGGVVALPDDEAAHAARVMRVSVGDPVVLFCGDGRESTGHFTSVDKRKVFVQVGPPQEVSREPDIQLDIFVSLPKGDRAKWLVEKLTELGVRRIVPVTCQRTQTPPSPAAIEKLRRLVIEASKQSERNCLLELTAPQPFLEILQLPVEKPSTATVPADTPVHRLIAHPGGQSWPQIGNFQPFQRVQLLVGPEGGFSAEEFDLASAAGWIAVGLGSTILRIETAAVAAAAIILMNAIENPV